MEPTCFYEFVVMDNDDATWSQRRCNLEPAFSFEFNLGWSSEVKHSVAAHGNRLLHLFVC